MKASETLQLVALFEASYARELTDTTKKLWIELFANVEFPDAVGALNEIAATENYPPTPQAVRQRAVERSSGMRDFAAVWQEMIETASTCDYFDPNPPASLSPMARQLARQLGWSDFRVSDPYDTYYTHQARRLYEEITARATRRIAAGKPALPVVDVGELEPGWRELIEGIGDDDDA